MKQYEYSAKNVQDAILKGLKELNLKQEDVDIKIISEGGLFSKSKILIITEEPDEVLPKIEEKVKEPTKPKKEKVEEKTVEVKLEKTEKTNKKQTPKTVNKKEDSTEKLSVAFIKDLAKKLGAKVEATITEEDENLVVALNGENAGVLIGYRGEGLTGIQYIANVIEQQNEEKENKKRIVLNVENYKEKREEALTRLADRMAKKVIKTGRSQRLEPMNSYDRRIIHAALTNSDVKTYSKGDEPRRYLVIEPKNKQDVL